MVKRGFPTLTNLVGRWRAEDEPTGALASWTDLSGNGNHLLQATGAAQPINTASQLNGKAAVIFDGVDDFMQASFTLVQPEEVWVVYRSDTWELRGCISDGYNRISMLLDEFDTSPKIRIYDGASVYSTYSLGAYHVARALYNGASSELSIDNETPVTGDAANVTDADGLTLGSRGINDNYFNNVGIAEAFILTAASTPTEKTEIYAYLNAQYGWSL